MSILLTKEYSFPYWDYNLSTFSPTITEYVTQIKNDFIENFGFYIYGDITTYNDRTVCYFSESENSFPCFCFIHAVTDSTSPKSGNSYYNPYYVFYIAPVLYDDQEDTFIPKIYEQVPSPTGIAEGGTVYKNLYSIAINCRHETYLPTIKYIELTDGRKILCFKNKFKNTHLDATGLIAMNGCLYYTLIKNENENNNFWNWIFLTRSPASSYIPEINGTISYNEEGNFHECPYQYPNPRFFSSAGGFIPSFENGKDFLLKLPRFYLGCLYYIENILFFSKVLNFNTSGPVGSIVTIKNKDYIILQHNTNNENIKNAINLKDADKTAVNTISLITPVDIEIEESNSPNPNNNNSNENENNSNNNEEENENPNNENIPEETPSFSGGE